MQRVMALLRSPKPVKWIFDGDSITHGALHTFGWRDYSELFTERIRYERGRTRDVVIKTAISGNSTSHILADFDWRVKQFQPDVVFLMFGMNDCEASRKVSLDAFRENLATICDRLAAVRALPVLQTTCPILPFAQPSRATNLPRYMQAVRDVAKEKAVPCIDHTAYWQELLAKSPGMHQYWMSDAIHPNNFGHQLFAECLFKALEIFDPSSPTCRLFRP